MPHKFAIGSSVYYQSGSLSGAAKGTYKITQQMPVERDNRVLYRIKSTAEAFERTADEGSLSRD